MLFHCANKPFVFADELEVAHTLYLSPLMSIGFRLAVLLRIIEIQLQNFRFHGLILVGASLPIGDGDIEFSALSWRHEDIPFTWAVCQTDTGHQRVDAFPTISPKLDPQTVDRR